MKKIFAIVMVVSILGAFLAGCSKSDDGGATGTTSSTPANGAGTSK